MKQLSSGLTTHLAGGVTTLCRCWRLARKDGTVMGFTDHDRDLVFDGVTYQAATGFAASAIEDQLGLAVSNLDVDGALSSAAITEADIHAGRYDDAEVTVFLVNWAAPAQRVILRKGFLGQVERGEVAFKAELRGLAARLEQVAGRVFQRTCPWELGDARCGVDLIHLSTTARAQSRRCSTHSTSPRRISTASQPGSFPAASSPGRPAPMPALRSK
jgi:uncharacterized phage protein (TIGR02218 family)